MDIEKKQLIDNFIQNNKDDETFNLVIEKLSDFLSSFLNDVIEKSNNTLGFKLNLIGDYYLSSNFSTNNFVNILIDYYVDEDDYNFSENRGKKGHISKLATDTFNYNKNIVPTIKELSRALYNELSVKLQNVKIHLRKNCIGLRYLDYKFFIFFKKSNADEKQSNFIIKSKEYCFNFETLHQNLMQKNLETKGNFFKLVKFFKLVELELMLINKLTFKASNILYFYENLLYNLPNELLNNKLIYDNFIIAINYFNNIDFEELKTADDLILVNDYYQLKTKPAITTFDIKETLKQCKVFIDNIDKIFMPNENV